MTKQVVKTTNAPGAIGPYSQGLVVGPFVYTSGQIPLHPETGEMASTIEEQTKQSLNNVKAILEQAGATMDQVVKTVVFLQDLADFDKMNEVYATYFGEDAPTRSCVQVARLPKDAKVEIEAIAYLG